MTWISAREAAAILETAGLARSQARRLLAAGVAGEVVRTRSATLYDAALVAELVTRPSVDVEALPPPTDQVLLEIRVGERPGARVELSHVSAALRVLLGEEIRRLGFVPTVLTCAGFVVGAFAGTAVHQVPGAPSRAWLDLAPAGPWGAAFERHRLYSPPGNQWLLSRRAAS